MASIPRRTTYRVFEEASDEDAFSARALSGYSYDETVKLVLLRMAISIAKTSFGWSSGSDERQILLRSDIVCQSPPDVDRLALSGHLLVLRQERGTQR